MDDFSKRQYQAVNECIYCGSKSNLTDEHIIPYSLKGWVVLPKSSCTDCARITSMIESLAKELRPVRRAINAGSRHKTDHPAKCNISLETENGQKTSEVLSYARRAIKGADDAALIVGTSKDLMEAVAAYILLQKWGVIPTNQIFQHYWDRHSLHWD